MKTTWIVTSDYVRGVLTYFVEHKETGERRGTFDCEPWAEEMAAELNREEWAKKVIREDPRGSTAERIEAIHVALSVLGNAATMGQIYKWAEGG